MAGNERDAGGLARVGERLAAEFERWAGEPLAPGLYLVATPIGNLGDITVRALAVLARADTVRCEDTRRTRALLSHFGVSARLAPYHEHNAAAERPRVLADLAARKTVALVSDAGTPLVSDPGYKLVREAIEAGFSVESLPGPSAAIAALTSSGLPTDAFLFAGFPPAKAAARRAKLAELACVPATVVFFEAATRLAESLGDMAEMLGPRPAVVARELTKLHEDFMRGSLADLAREATAREMKGEIVIVIGPPDARTVADAVINARLGAALDAMSLRDAAKFVSEELNVARGRVYDLALAYKRETS